MGMERREHQRVDVDLDGGLKKEVDPEFSDILMANLSLGGCFIKTRMPEPPGSMVMLRFALPGDTAGGVIKAVGRVCWVRSGAEGPPGMGVQFVRIEDHDLAELKRYILGVAEPEFTAEALCA